MKDYIPALAIGTVIGLAVPSASLLGASEEIVSFVSLLMAGLLPAMILTATVIRGDRFSSARVKEYGLALNKQLDFWAVLFFFAIVSVFCISAAKVASDLKLPAVRQVAGYDLLPDEFLRRVLLAVGCASVAVILARLLPAYRGLRSVLALSVQMAELQALANDRTLREALGSKATADYAEPVPATWTADVKPTREQGP